MGGRVGSSRNEDVEMVSRWDIICQNLKLTFPRDVLRQETRRQHEGCKTALLQAHEKLACRKCSVCWKETAQQ